jgi:hypothetical protein
MDYAVDTLVDAPAQTQSIFAQHGRFKRFNLLQSVSPAIQGEFDNCVVFFRDGTTSFTTVGLYL